MAKEAQVGGVWLPATCSAADLAVIFGVSPRTITNLVATGVLVRAEQHNMFQTTPSIHGYLNSLRSKAAGRAGDGELAAERTKREKVEREISELKLAQLRGEVLSLDEVSEAWGTLARSFRSSVMSIPSKLRALIPHLTAHDQETARQLCVDTLTSLAEEIDVGVVGADGKDLAADDEE